MNVADVKVKVSTIILDLFGAGWYIRGGDPGKLLCGDENLPQALDEFCENGFRISATLGESVIILQKTEVPSPKEKVTDSPFLGSDPDAVREQCEEEHSGLRCTLDKGHAEYKHDNGRDRWVTGSIPPGVRVTGSISSSPPGGLPPVVVEPRDGRPGTWE